VCGGSFEHGNDLRVPQTAGNFLNLWATVSLSVDGDINLRTEFE
jgi:hypothetical protein